MYRIDLINTRHKALEKLFRFVFAALASIALTAYVFITPSTTELSTTAFANSHVLAKPHCLTALSPAAYLN
jgi:hypothetical protein